MKTRADHHQPQATKYSFPKKPVYYFHADEDFREDREWGRDKDTDLMKGKFAINRIANNAVVQ